MRPKSIATVVVCLAGRAAMSSTWLPAEVSSASVVSGMISETEVTNVVLPTPNPPAITILTEVVARLESTEPAGAPKLEPAKSTEDPFHEIRMRCLVGLFVHQHKALVGQIADEDASDTDRHPQQCGDLCHRAAVCAQLADRACLRITSGIDPFAGEARYDQCFDRVGVPWPRPAAGQCVRPHHRVGLIGNVHAPRRCLTARHRTTARASPGSAPSRHERSATTFRSPPDQGRRRYWPAPPGRNPR